MSDLIIPIILIFLRIVIDLAPYSPQSILVRDLPGQPLKDGQDVSGLVPNWPFD